MVKAFSRLLGEAGDEAPFYGAPEVTYEHQITVASANGVSGYLIPLGNYFKNAASECVLEVDMGAGFVTKTFGVDFDGFQRSAAPASVVDMRIGFYYLSPVVAGWTFRFTWRQRVALLTPLSIAKAKLTGPGGTPDMSVKWLQNGSNAPNGVIIPQMTGYVVEFWRRIERSGGFDSSSFGSFQRTGVRYIPYFRGPASQFNFTSNEFYLTGTSKRRKYRVCYYNPVTFARSFLSTDIIVVNSRYEDSNGLPALDTVPPRAADPQVRNVFSVWLE